MCDVLWRLHPLTFSLLARLYTCAAFRRYIEKMIRWYEHDGEGKRAAEKQCLENAVKEGLIQILLS